MFLSLPKKHTLDAFSAKIEASAQGFFTAFYNFTWEDETGAS